MDPAPTPPPTNLTSTVANPVDVQRATAVANAKKDIYASSVSEIFAKNFTAGFARALGGIIIYLIFIGISIFIASKTLLPMIQPLISSLTQSLQFIQNPTSVGQGYNQDAQKLLQQLQQK